MKNFSKVDIILGAIAGDIIGSNYERNNLKTDKLEEIDLFNENCHMTDDTVLTFAILDALLNKRNFADVLWEYGNKYKNSGFGGMFYNWLSLPDKLPYNSFGNGSAMRVSPVVVLANTFQECMDLSRKTAEVTHNHKEGINGAQAITMATVYAFSEKPKEEIKKVINFVFGYNLDFTLDEIRYDYLFNATCQGSVPQAIVGFLESENYEDGLRKIISIGGDTDTLCTMYGTIAAAYYKEIPGNIKNFVLERLPKEFIYLLNKTEKFLESGKEFKYYERNKLKIINKSSNPFPEYKIEGDSGFDLRAYITPYDEGGKGFIELAPLQRKLINTGLHVEIPDGFELQIRPRSGLALKNGIFCNFGTIDVGYRGDIGVIVFNLSDKSFEIKNGDRIAQAVLCPVSSETFTELIEVQELSKTTRGNGGFGHTGKE